MNNWCSLLLAVVAVLQPIESFTERNLIDGRQECCDHRSNSIAQDTRLYGNYHKSNTEERHLNTREDIHEDGRYDARDASITRSRERLIVQREERRISLEPAKSRAVNRFVSEQEHHQRISVDARNSRLTRDDQNRRLRERFARDTSSKYERDTLESRRVIRVSRDDARTLHIENKRLYKDTLNSRNAPNSEDLRRVSANRDTMALLNRQTDDVAQDIRRDFRTNAFRIVTRSQLDNNRERRTLGHRIDENRRSQSLDTRANNLKRQESLPSRTDSREDRRNSFRSIPERVDDRKLLDQNRESNDRISTIRRHSIKRVSVERRREFHDTPKRVDFSRRDIRERNNERIDERRQQRDESRMSRARASTVRRSRVSPSDERIQALPRETGFFDANIRSERNVRNSERKGERREADRDMLRASRDNQFEPKQGSRLSQLLEATTRDGRLVRIDIRKDDSRQLQTRSLDRVSASRASRDRSIEHEQNSRTPSRQSESNIREDRAARYSRDIRNVERLHERRQQHDESRLSRDHTKSRLRESRDDAERRQGSNNSGNILRGAEDTRSQRESRVRGELRHNEHIDASRRVREIRIRASGEQALTRIVRETERRQERELSRSSRFTERAPSAEQNFRARADIRGERNYVRRETRDGEKQSRDRTVAVERLTGDVSAPERRYDTRITSRNTETSARLQRIRSLDNIRDERRAARERDENRASRARISMNRLSVERTEDEGIGATRTRDSRANAQNEANRKNRYVRMNYSFEVRRQQDAKRSIRDIVVSRSVERRSREFAARDIETNNRVERLSRNRDETKTNNREVRNIRNFRAVESGAESITTERELQTNRRNSVTERVDRPANRESRGLRFETRSSILDKNTSANTRQYVIDSRFRNMESKVYYTDTVEKTSESQNAMNWQMIFYTLQGAYLCGILMQILTEKSKGKSRNFTWWASSAKELVKVD